MTFKQWLAVVYIPLVANHIYAEENGAYLKPTDPVFKVGSDITLECRSPENYNTDYPSVKFIVKHEGKKIAEKAADTSSVEGYLTIRHIEIDTSIEDAGLYTCEIVPEGGEKVSVRTNVYVIEDDELTVFGQAGKETKRSCFRPGQYTDLQLVSYWKVNDKTQKGDLTIAETAVDDAFKSYSCLVTSKEAIKKYRIIDSAAKNGAVTEITRKLSVIELDVSKCIDKKRCTLVANVYGNTPVNISWVVDREPHSPDLVIMENVTSSNTSELNITSSSTVELLVTGGQNMWRENITLEEDVPKPKDQSSNKVEIIVGVVVAVVIIIILIIVIYCTKCRKGKNNTNLNGSSDERQKLNMDKFGKDEKLGKDEDEAKDEKEAKDGKEP